MHLLLQTVKNPHFLNEISSKNLKFLHGPRLIDVYHYHAP
jgi:hypothetical protein